MMRSIFKKRWLMVTAGLLALAGSVTLLPINLWVEKQLVAALEGQGFSPVALHVAHLGLRGVVLENLALGGDMPLKIARAGVDYSLTDIRQKRVSSLTVEGVTLAAYQDAGQWRVRGLESRIAASPEQKNAVSIPVTGAAFAALPLQALTVKQSMLTLEGKGIAATIPFSATWQTLPVPTLHYETAVAAIHVGDVSFNLGKLLLDVALDEAANQWRGTWTLEGFRVDGSPLPLPPLTAKGTLVVNADTVVVQGAMTDAASAYQANFSAKYSLADAAKSTLLLQKVRMPWNEGVVGLNQATIPLQKGRAKSFTLTVEHVSIAALMKALTGERATGTGLVSGTIPVTIDAAGRVLLHEGNLKAEDSGIIAIAPETIPGDNAQITLVRDVLKNLHYNLLSMTMDSGEDGTLSVLLAVEGKNPDVSGGRPVRLNVHLNGDVLNLIQQNVMAISAPTQLLEQDK